MSLKHFLSFFLICLASPSFSQLISDSQIIENPGDQVNLTSPYHTTLSFFKNLEEGNYHPEKTTQTLDFTGISDPNTTQLTTKLCQIFEGKGVLIGSARFPMWKITRTVPFLQNTLSIISISKNYRWFSWKRPEINGSFQLLQ